MASGPRHADARLRIGIGNCFSEDKKDFVLSCFAKEEGETIENALERASKAINIWVATGINDCMGMFN